MTDVTKSDLISALVQAQSEYKPLKKAHTGQIQTRTYSYADLHDTIEATREALLKNKLAVLQYPDVRALGDHVQFGVATVLAHASGSRIEGFYPITDDGLTQQEMGSAITYARRYSYAAIVGLASEDDDDGAAASARPAAAPRSTRAASTSAPDTSGKPACPQCNQTRPVLKSKFEDCDWFCYAKTGGCGHKWFDAQRPAPAEAVASATPSASEAPPKASKDQIEAIRALASKAGLNAATLQPVLRKAAPQAPTDAKGMIRSDVLTAGEAAMVIQALQAPAEPDAAPAHDEGDPF